LGDENPNPAVESSAGMSFLKITLIAIAICAALVGGAVYFLQGSSNLPFNYNGFDTNGK
jgi:hypothetical protein